MSEQTMDENVKNTQDVSESSSINVNTNWNKVSQAEQKLPVGVKNNNKPCKNEDFDFFEELSKRFVSQQDQTIRHRSTLMRWFARITGSQLIVINVLIVIAIFIKPKMVNIILDFLKFFIGATFIELLGGLIIIVKFAFSHETYDMLKHLSYVEPKSK